jgi:hypothetical protein
MTDNVRQIRQLGTNAGGSTPPLGTIPFWFLAGCTDPSGAIGAP